MLKANAKYSLKTYSKYLYYTNFLLLNIVLITGGPSAEREVSVASSKSILKALRENGHNVKVVDPINGDKDVPEETIFKSSVKKESPSLKELKEIRRNSNRKILDCINSPLFDDADIVFLGVHGKFGEDGRLQSLLELRGKSYTGSNVFSSALAMDKDISKIIFKSREVRTPAWITFSRENAGDSKNINEKILRTVGYPCVVKPNDEGSTVGLSIVQPDVEDVQLYSAIDLAFSFSDKIIIEQCIKGRELTATIIGDETYPVIEIKPDGGFYDYEHKYTKGLTNYFCPADIPDDVRDKVYSAALEAHNALGCSVYSRVDFMMNDKCELFCLEVNTLPGMTETSLVPKSAAANGVSFNNLIEKILELSLRKITS